MSQRFDTVLYAQLTKEGYSRADALAVALGQKKQKEIKKPAYPTTVISTPTISTPTISTPTIATVSATAIPVAKLSAPSTRNPIADNVLKDIKYSTHCNLDDIKKDLTTKLKDIITKEKMNLTDDESDINELVIAVNKFCNAAFGVSKFDIKAEDVAAERVVVVKEVKQLLDKLKTKEDLTVNDLVMDLIKNETEYHVIFSLYKSIDDKTQVYTQFNIFELKFAAAQKKFGELEMALTVLQSSDGSKLTTSDQILESVYTHSPHVIQLKTDANYKLLMENQELFKTVKPVADKIDISALITAANVQEKYENNKAAIKEVITNLGAHNDQEWQRDWIRNNTTEMENVMKLTDDDIYVFSLLSTLDEDIAWIHDFMFTINLYRLSQPIYNIINEEITKTHPIDFTITVTIDDKHKRFIDSHKADLEKFKALNTLDMFVDKVIENTKYNYIVLMLNSTEVTESEADAILERMMKNWDTGDKKWKDVFDPEYKNEVNSLIGATYSGSKLLFGDFINIYVVNKNHKINEKYKSFINEVVAANRGEIENPDDIEYITIAGGHYSFMSGGNRRSSAANDDAYYRKYMKYKHKYVQAKYN